jgi:hypothetical protein
MPSALHRIEPQLLTMPQFYGSAGEPSLLMGMPNTSMPPMSQGQPQGPGMAPLLGMLAASLFSGQAQAPNGIMAGVGRNPYDAEARGPLEQFMRLMQQHGKPIDIQAMQDPSERLSNDQLGYITRNAAATTENAIRQRQDEPIDIMDGNLGFSDAFAKARKMGLVEFTWRGRPYTTKLKE